MTVTARAIARALGMSPSTVSQALNNKGMLTMETRERVIEQARELGYPVAIDPFGIDRAISGRPVWFVLSGANRVPPRSELAEFSSNVLKGVEQAFAPYRTVLSVVAESDLHQAPPDDLIGIIVVGGSVSEDTEDLLRSGRRPTVTVGCHLSDTICGVECDGVQGIRLAVDHLCALGHRNIGFFNGPVTLRTSDQKLTGYIRACHDHHLTVRPVATGIWPWDPDAAEGTALELFATEWKGITAVVCAYDQLALGALRAARRLGMSVPADVSIVGYHDEGISATSEPPLTTVALPVLEMGKLAARLIVSAGRNRDVVGTRVVLPPRLVVRESTSQVGL